MQGSGSLELTPSDFQGYFSMSSSSRSSSRSSPSSATASKTGNGNSFDSVLTDLDAEAAADQVMEGGVDDTLARSVALWNALATCLAERPPKNAARVEVSEKLISNHVAVLRDVCNGSPTTQLQLTRVPPSHAAYADQALREVARRLLGKGASHLPQVHLDHNCIAQVKAWSTTATYLSGRVQSAEHERPGRQPDMSPVGADLFRAALQDIWWTTYEILKKQ